MGLLRAAPLLIAILTLVTSCSTLRAHRDPWCGHLAAFANSAQVETAQSIELVTDWAEWSKWCVDHGTEAGQQFCRWLIPNTSTEYASANIRRVLALPGSHRPARRPLAQHAGVPDRQGAGVRRPYDR